MASSSSSSKSLASPPLHSPHFSSLQIQENGRENENEDEDEELHHIRRTPNPSFHTDAKMPSEHHPTPLHRSTIKTKPTTRDRPESKDAGDRTVSFNKCRPTSQKTLVVPLDIKRSNTSPNSIFKSILSSLTRKSPRPSNSSSTAREEQWKLAATEISHKLIEATRKRDEALLEASRIKHSMSEMEKKLEKLEIYCHNLSSSLEAYSNSPLKKDINFNTKQDKVIELFLNRVSDGRLSVRAFSRSLTIHLRQMGLKVYERISYLLQPYEVKISFSMNPRSLLFYLEALLNIVFYEDFESTGFQKNGSDHFLNPVQRCEANLASFALLQGLSWEEVLSKGTRHYSEEFSRFCDRKMSEIVAMLEWNRPWKEPLLQAFFGAAKSVWLVHLLAFSVHPSLSIFRVDKGVRFDGAYMEDMCGDRARKLVPTMVRVMVAPGFYVSNNVVKCKVLCRYNS